MSRQRFRALASLCLLVNAISGSPRIAENDRQPRYASCPSCRGERPDALVSWAVPPRRGYRDLVSESVPWQSGRSFGADPFVYPSEFIGSPYGRASRSRGGPTIDRPADTCKRENPFSFGRSLDFDVAPAQAAPAHRVTGPVTPRSPRVPVARSLARPSYGRPLSYDAFNGQSDFSPAEMYGGEPFESSKRYAQHPSESPRRDFRVVYRADKRVEDDREEEETPVAARQRYPGIPFSPRRGTAGVRTRPEDRYVQRQREQPEDFGRIYEPRVERKPYNAYGTMQNIERDPVEVMAANNSGWHHRTDEGREEGENLDARRTDEDDEQTDGGTSETTNEGHVDFSGIEPREEIEERRQMTKLNETPEEPSTQTAVETTEKAAKTSPVIMQIPRRVTVGA